MVISSDGTRTIGDNNFTTCSQRVFPPLIVAMVAIIPQDKSNLSLITFANTDL